MPVNPLQTPTLGQLNPVLAFQSFGLASAVTSGERSSVNVALEEGYVMRSSAARQEGCRLSEVELRCRLVGHPEG